MTVYLYKSNSEDNAVHKLLMDEIVLEGSLVDREVNIEEPDILIYQSTTDIFRYNYAYIPDFGRYYFFRMPVSIDVNKLYVLHLESDPLMSFKDEFLLNSGLVSNSKNYGNMYLKDTSLPIQQNTKLTTVLTSKSPFSNREASIIMTATMISATKEEGEIT